MKIYNQSVFWHYFKVGFIGTFSFGAVILCRVKTTEELVVSPCNKKQCERMPSEN